MIKRIVVRVVICMLVVVGIWGAVLVDRVLGQIIPGGIIEVVKIEEDNWEISYAQSDRVTYFEYCVTKSLPRNALLWIATNYVKQLENEVVSLEGDIIGLGSVIAVLEDDIEFSDTIINTLKSMLDNSESEVANLKDEIYRLGQKISWLAPFSRSYYKGVVYSSGLIWIGEGDLLIKKAYRVEYCKWGG